MKNTNTNKREREREREREYIPETFLGALAKLLGAPDDKVAYIDIGSSVVNTSSDAIPIIGNAVGMGMSILDTGYNIYKSIRDPSVNNWADTGLTALGILPGFGSIKDTKTALKAGSTLAGNTVRAGRKAARKTITRRSSGLPKARLNVIDKNGNIIGSARVPYFDNISGRQAAIYSLGTIGNYGYSIQDSLTGADYLLNDKLR